MVRWLKQMTPSVPLQASSTQAMMYRPSRSLEYQPGELHCIPPAPSGWKMIQEYAFGVAVFDNAQVRHAYSPGVLKMKFE